MIHAPGHTIRALNHTIRASALCLAFWAPVALAAPAEPEVSPDRRAITASETYVRLDPVMASVQAGRDVRGLLHVEIGLDAPDPAMRARIAQRMPRLRDAYISAMAVYSAMGYGPGEVPDAERISALLQRATDQALGEPGATVMIGMIMIHDQ
jgi:hypothetical protein